MTLASACHASKFLSILGIKLATVSPTIAKSKIYDIRMRNSIRSSRRHTKFAIEGLDVIEL